MDRDIRIVEFDDSTVTDDQIDRYHQLLVRMLAERTPDDPPPAVGAAVRALRDVGAHEHACGFAVVEAGRWVGVARAIVPAGDDPTVRVELAVLPEARRRGIGSQLLRRLVTVATDAGKGLLIGDTYDSVLAGSSFAESVGAEPGLRSHVNRLVLDDVDRVMVDRWIEEGPARAPGYELVGYDGRTPDDLVEQVADIINVMNDAPRDELDTAPFKLTVEMFRGFEEVGLASGTEVWWLLAREKRTGLVVGETDVRWHRNQPDAVLQGFTIVRPEHRGHALGKWLKATMLRRVVDDRPEARHITTSNADSNDAMVGINSELGFEPYLGTTTWQMQLDAGVSSVHP